MSDTGSQHGEEWFRVNALVAWRDLDGHVFAVTPDNRQHELSGDVELTVWNLLANESLTLADLTTRVAAEFDVEPEVAIDDLREFLSACVDASLLDRAASSGA